MTRRAAIAVWAGLLVVPLAFLGVTSTAEPAAVSPALVGPVFWLAVGASALNVVLSRVLPRRLGPAEVSEGEPVAFTRAVVGLALCEAAAMAPLVAHLVTRDSRLLGVLVLDLLALVVLFPSEARWEDLLPAGERGAGSGRTVR